MAKNAGRPAPTSLYAESSFLPFALLRFNTLRPDLVFILCRKPCTFLRCLFLGCSVIFMIAVSHFHIIKPVFGHILMVRRIYYIEVTRQCQQQ
jgi:hypothetical protein